MKTLPDFKKPFGLFFLFAILFSLSVLPKTALAIDTQTISAYPTHSSDTDPRTKSWFIYTLPAGMSKQDSLTVVNNSTNPMTVMLYPVDSTTTNTGTFALASENAPRVKIGSWVKLSTSQVTLEPKEQKTINFTITIPNNANMGDYSGGIIVQQTQPQKVVSKGMGINVISRVGVRIYETVPGLNQVNMEVRNLEYRIIDNHLYFSFVMENKGTVHTAPTGILEVKDMFGRVVDTVSLDDKLGTTVPDKPLTINVPTNIMSPVLGWNSAMVALYYSPTKAAVASINIGPNPLATFVVILLVLLGALFAARKAVLSQVKKTAFTPKMQLIAGGVLLGAIGVSALIAYLLNKFFAQ